MEINGKNFTIGADPELFVTRGGVFESAYGIIPGTKKDPFKVNNGAVQVDGMALEFNIDPASTEEQFDHNLTSVMEQLKEMVPDMEFYDGSSVNFSEEFLSSQPIQAIDLGCEPDYNGYTLSTNEKPDGMTLMRTAGGHAHIGGFFADNPFEPTHFKTSARLARILDETLGLPSLVWDEDDQRRSLYGQAGAFRPKVYGMEYRTLSNKWLFNPRVRKFVYQGVKQALQLMFDPSYEANPEVREVINNSDRSSSLFKNNADVHHAQKILEA